MKKALTFILLLVLLLPAIANALTLKESTDMALAKNPVVLASQKKVAVASAKLDQAWGTFFPSVKLDGNYGQAYSQPSVVQVTSQTTAGAVTQTISFGTDAPTTAKGITASLSQAVFVPALFPGLQMAQRGVDLAREDLRSIEQDTACNVAIAYFGVLAAERFVKLSEDALETAKAHQAQVNSMLNRGVAAKADFLRAEVQVANSEVALTKAKNTFAMSLNSFNNVLGRRLSTKVELSGEVISLPSALPDKDDLVKLAFENSPTWKQFVYSKQLAEENVSLAQTAYLPTVVLSGQGGKRITDYPTFSSDVNSWSVSGVASWTLFDGLIIRNRVREAAANLEAQNATEEQVRNALELNVYDAFLNLKSTIDTIASAKKAVEFAEESYKLSDFRYASGVGTNLEVVDAQVAWNQARIDYLKAWYDLEVAKAKLNKVVGKEVI